MHKSEYLALFVLLLTFCSMALGYSLVIPLGEGPDEVDHFAYVQYVLMHKRLPPPGRTVSGESHQPPFYYFVTALATSWIPQEEFTPVANPDFVFDDPQTPNLLLHTRREAFPFNGAVLAWYWGRWLSVVLGAISVWSVWRIAALFVPNDRWIAWGAATFVAFLPAFTSLSAMVNNDNLVIMLSSVSVLQILHIAQKPPRLREASLLGILLGLAALTKLSGLVVWLFAAIVLAFLAWQSRELKNWAIQAVVCFGAATIIVAPWITYNLANYGDPLGWSVVLSVAPLRQAPMTFNELVKVTSWGLYTSFWGRFGGGLHLQMADAIYALLGSMVLLAVLGWVHFGHSARTPEENNRMRRLLAAFVLFWALMLGAFARWTLTVLGTDQARQLFLGLPLFAVVLTWGLARLSESHKKGVLVASCTSLLVLNLTVLLYLNATFSGSPQNLAALPKLGGTTAPADFGNAIRVLDFRVEPTQGAPGDSIRVQIQWQALSDITENYWLLLRLGSRESVAQKDGVPSAGRSTTDWWRDGQTFASHHTLIIPRDAAPGIYPLQLGIHPFGKWDWLPVRGAEMLTLGNIQVRKEP